MDDQLWNEVVGMFGEGKDFMEPKVLTDEYNFYSMTLSYVLIKRKI